MEVLEDVLSMCRFRVEVYARWEIFAPCGISIPESTSAKFHAVRAGESWIRLGGRLVRLKTGDFVLVPHGDAHDLLYSPEIKPMALQDARALASPTEGRVVRLPASGPRNELINAFICGGCYFGNRAHRSLFSFLPKLIHVHSEDAAELKLVLDLAEQELREPRPASSTVLARLGDILFIEGIRAYRRGLHPGEGSWLSATLDPNIAQVLGAIHSDHSKSWTLDVLANNAAMSRSSLASRFRELVGVPIMAYVTRVRMSHASTLLENPELSISEISSRVGYVSVPAFHRAFVREIGISPGEFRKSLKDPHRGF